MFRIHPIRIRFGILFLALAAAAPAGCSEAAPPLPLRCLLAESVEQGKIAWKAGLRPGDRLLSWCRSGSGGIEEGTFGTYWDWYCLAIGWAGDHSVTLVAQGDGHPFSLDLPPGDWGAFVRPALGQEWEAFYEAGRTRIREGDVAGGVEIWKTILEGSGADEDLPLQAWLWKLAGDGQARARDAGAAELSYLEGLSRARRSGEPAAECILLEVLGKNRERRNDFQGAEDCYRRGAETARRAWGRSSFRLMFVNHLLVIFLQRGRLEEADELAPEILETAGRLIPETMLLARILNNLGTLAEDRGDLPLARSRYEKSLALKEKFAPGSLDVASSLNNLGTLSMVLGDLDAAQDCHARALAIKERLAPGSFSMGVSLNNLSSVAESRGDLAAAEDYVRRSLAIRESLDPGGLGVARSLDNLGTLEARRGEFGTAQEHLERSIAIYERQAPGSLEMADALWDLGQVAVGSHDDGAAQQWFERALAIHEKLAPLTTREANSLSSLGKVLARRGDLERACALLLRAVSGLDFQRGKLGMGSETGDLFSAGYSDWYRDLVEIQVRLRREGEAFRILERFRARSLLSMLAERDLVFSKDAPEELLREQKRLRFEYEEAQEDLAELSPERERSEVDALLRRHRDLRAEQADIVRKLREASPRLASLQYPDPLDAEQTGEILGKGTLLLSYCAQIDRVRLFSLIDGDLEVYEIRQGREALARSVARFRGLVADPGSDGTEIGRFARTLGAILLGPVRGEIRRAQRILVCPDGPLHLLPFSALAAEGDRPLVLDKPVSYAISATVLCEILKRGREAPADIRLAAFGDPEGGSSGSGGSRGFPRRSRVEMPDLQPLPGSRAEVASIAALCRDPKVYFGSSATEGEAKRLGSDVDWVHFACHALVDHRFPLDSCLALAPSAGEGTNGSENGFLQAWEILEQVRLDADLVTLSACQTGLGKEMGGEGLVGLTRAFQYAGARSVLSSLWEVSDESTGHLMARFYGYLKAGQAKTDALRRAQGDLLATRGGHGPAGEDWSHPFHWAGFVLNGAPE